MNNQSRILIIDDEEVVLDSCTRILKSSAYKLATATNGRLGLDMVKEFQPDLIYVDLKMPGISGIEVIEKIRDTDPTIVVIVITGFATVSSAVEAMKNGAYDFLPKPFTPDEFRLITQRGLDKRRLILETIQLRREKEMLREQFAAIVSHELKAPLGAVQQNLFVLISELSDQLTEDQKARFERMQTNITDLINLILTWLRVLSVDVMKIRENFKPTSISTIITKATESVMPHATRKDVEIIPSVKEPLALINGDEGTLVEAVVNILGNAIKYSRTGSKIMLNVDEIEKNVIISVADFYTGKDGQKVEKSTGLGLAITRRIIEAHNGTVSVESEFGKGATFTICLPILKNT
jgi:two-component system sensor histidine kinase/response regulator